jgi:hypothetical protein
MAKPADVGPSRFKTSLSTWWGLTSLRKSPSEVSPSYAVGTTLTDPGNQQDWLCTGRGTQPHPANIVPITQLETDTTDVSLSTALQQ